jgi:signal transduction histidine kinase
MLYQRQPAKPPGTGNGRALERHAYEKEALRSQLEIQEDTFKSIAQELHDNIGQMLSVVKLIPFRRYPSRKNT